MTNHIWGINWQRYHAEREDMPHIERMGYRSFTIYEWMWSNRDFVRELLSVARQDAIFLNRDHPLSEEKDQQWRNDPAAKGRAHADEWAKKVSEGRVYTPLDRTYFLGINEPASEHFARQIDAYNEAFCRRMTEHGLRAAAYSFGVGHPATVDLRPDTLPDWSHYAASAAAVLEGGHIAAMHEYGAPDGYGWGYWCNRLEHCPYPFDVILDECGIDYGVVQAGQLYGWMRFLTPDEYLVWLDNFQAGMAERAHTRKVKIKAMNIFGYDHGTGKSKDWHSFDIRPLRDRLEIYPWRQVESKPSTTIHMPTITTSAPKTLYVTADLLNVRAKPGVSADNPVIDRLGKGDTVTATAQATVHGETWQRIGDGRWVHGGWLSDSQIVQPEPEPIATDTWTRSYAFTARWEGGYQAIENDKGNWTGGEVGKGELKGTKYGISAASYPHLDIKNLTRAEAEAIYKRDYWRASGADKLPWPACLIVFDTAVLHGVGRAQEWLGEAGPNPLHFAARRLRSYTGMDNWHFWGVAWVRRVAELLEEAAK